MLSPQGQAADGGLSDRFEPPADAYADRLQRRAAALERQLDTRIAQIDALRDQLAHHERVSAATQDELSRVREECEELRKVAAEHAALMNTFTLRALRRPRAWYGAARRRVPPPPGG